MPARQFDSLLRQELQKIAGPDVPPEDAPLLIVRRVIQLALGRESSGPVALAACRELLDRIYGKARESLELHVSTAEVIRERFDSLMRSEAEVVAEFEEKTT